MVGNTGRACHVPRTRHAALQEGLVPESAASLPEGHRGSETQTAWEMFQKIESKHINLRTRIKRLVRCTLCFSKTERMHDLVIGLFINRYAFGVSV